MTDTRLKLFAHGALVAVASGVAAALVFVLAARGSFVSMALGYFAPLPIMIASVSFGLSIGAAAAAVGASFVALVYHPVLGLMFVAMIGAPAALIATAAILAPPSAEGRPRDFAPTFAVLATAILAAVTVSSLLVFLTWRHGGFEPLVARLSEDGLTVVKEMLGQSHAAGPINAEDVTKFLIWAAPIGLVASELILMTINLWLAGRIAMVSGNLPRPWPRIADDLAIPPLLGALFAACCGLAFLGGLPGAIASVAATALGLIFAFQGLAVAHVLTRGSAMRFPLLLTMYALVLLLPLWPVGLLAIVGLADAAFHLRARRPASPRMNA